MDRIEKLNGFLALQPEDPFLLHALGLEYVSEGDDGRAGELFEKVIAVDPQYTGTYYHLAKLLERKGSKQKAEEIYALGMEACRKTGDDHAYRELKNAYDDLIY